MKPLLPIFLAVILPASSQEAFQPLPILAGGTVLPLYPSDSPLLKKEFLAEPEN